MKFSRFVSSRPLVLVLAVGVLLVLVAAQQVPGQRRLRLPSPYPAPEKVIRPGDIVNLTGTVQVTCSPLTVYVVPANKYLVVTDFEVGAMTPVEVLASGIPKYPFGFNDYHSSVGLAFPPNSSVQFSDPNCSNSFVTYALTGHLASP